MSRSRSNQRPGAAGWEAALAVAAFAVLCVAVLSVQPRLAEPDDYAYRASIVAVADGHFLTLSAGQVRSLAAQLTQLTGPAHAVLTGPGPLGGSIEQWIRLPAGRWISEKDPGYPYLAAPFQRTGLIRLAPLFYGALACLGLFFGARRWLGRWGGAAAVGLYCSSGAALLFAWRDYMPTFTDASLITAGTGALMWAMLADDCPGRRRQWAGLAAFAALELAAFARYTDVVVLGCAVVAVLAAWRARAAGLAGRAVAWWLGSVVVFAAGVAAFNALVYGGPLMSGYQPGAREAVCGCVPVTFSLAAIGSNLRYMPGHLMQAMPELVLGLAALAWIIARWVRLCRLRRAGPAGLASPGDPRHARGEAIRRDLAVGSALAGSWLSLWGLYLAYTWTAVPGLSTLQSARFYVPAAGAISVLGAWLLVRIPGLVRVPRQASLAAIASGAVIAAIFGLGIWSYHDMLPPPSAPPRSPHCNIGQPHCPAAPPHSPDGSGTAPQPG